MTAKHVKREKNDRRSSREVSGSSRAVSGRARSTSITQGFQYSSCVVTPKQRETCAYLDFAMSQGFLSPPKLGVSGGGGGGGEAKIPPPPPQPARSGGGGKTTPKIRGLGGGGGSRSANPFRA